jgi:alkanesulfonate monooxygenase SsuD/methylene tetrahydromethanopterin reductase-like flavin-dependent oxidoreductase (luciferase family)
MQFGVGFQSHIERSWKHAVLAEQMGFDNAWFVDSQLIASDVYACMALAAHHTQRITLGTGVTISDTRIAPVIAHSIATINQLAPGRVILGLGTGHTAWRAMGMPPITIKAFRNTIEVCRGMLRGETVPYRARGREGQVRFMDTENGYVNIKDPLPVYIAASHPRAQALAGEFGDGLITLSLLSPDVVRSNLEAVHKGWPARSEALTQNFAAMTVGVCCVLHAGEAIDSPRVIARVGPRIAVALHYAYEQSRQGMPVPEFLAPFLTDRYQQFLSDRWDIIHQTHSRFLHEGEDEFITPDAIRAMSLTGTRDEVAERIDGLKQAGLTQFVISPPWGYVEESIVEFAQQIIPAFTAEGRTKSTS